MRYEDVGVVTETGFENFTAFMPTTLDEIERTVRMKGMVQDYPPSAMPWRAPLTLSLRTTIATARGREGAKRQDASVACAHWDPPWAAARNRWRRAVPATR